MHAVTSCPQCQTKAKVPVEAIGRSVRCPKCQNVYQAAFLAEFIGESPASSSTQIQATPSSSPPIRAYADEPQEEELTDDFPRQWTQFPGVVRAAGIIWIVFGGLTLFGFALVMIIAALRAGPKEMGSIFGLFFCGGSLIALFGGGFILVGIQTIRGTTRDMLGNGIGSILFAAVIALASIAPLVNVRDRGFTMVFGLVVGLEVIALFLGGIFALVGRADYKAWRRENRPSKRERLRRLEEANGS